MKTTADNKRCPWCGRRFWWWTKLSLCLDGLLYHSGECARMGAKQHEKDFLEGLARISDRPVTKGPRVLPFNPGGRKT